MAYRAAEGDRAAGLGLQAEGGQFQRMGDGNVAFVAYAPHRADIGKAFAQAVLEAGQSAQAHSGVVAADHRLDRGVRLHSWGRAGLGC